MNPIPHSDAERIAHNIAQISQTIPPHVKLIAVSKTHPIPLLQYAYDAGMRLFAENRSQELALKRQALPMNDLQWHFIGHLQRNKVKDVIANATCIQSTDSERLLNAINAEALKQNKTIDCLLEVKIGQEETKTGFNIQTLHNYLSTEQWKTLTNIRISGIMAIGTFTDDLNLTTQEYKQLRRLFEELQSTYFANHKTTFKELSMGMSNDYHIAIDEGATMVRVGTSIFGNRIYPTCKPS